MSKVLATAARLNHLSMVSARDKESQGGRALERLTQKKKENNLLLEKKIATNEERETQLIDAQKDEGESWFSTGLKNVFGMETDSEELSVEVERSQIDQKYLGMRQENLQAQTGLITRKLQSNNSTLQQLSQDNRKIEESGKTIKPQNANAIQASSVASSKVMVRDQQAKGEAFGVSQESVRIDGQIQLRSIEDQGKQIENIHTADKEALAEKNRITIPLASRVLGK